MDQAGCDADGLCQQEEQCRDHGDGGAGEVFAADVDAVEAEIDHALKRAARLGQSMLKGAFEGNLVPQNPTEEPAEKLLERIAMERTPGNTAKAIPLNKPKAGRKPVQKSFFD